jgi:hypothetical protein
MGHWTFDTWLPPRSFDLSLFVLSHLFILIQLFNILPRVHGFILFFSSSQYSIILTIFANSQHLVIFQYFTVVHGTCSHYLHTFDSPLLRDILILSHFFIFHCGFQEFLSFFTYLWFFVAPRCLKTLSLFKISSYPFKFPYLVNFWTSYRGIVDL